MKKNIQLIKITISILLIILLFNSSNIPIATTINQQIQNTTNQINTKETEQSILVKTQTLGIPGQQIHQTYLSIKQANNLIQQIQNLQQKHPTSQNVPHLQQQLIQTLQEYDLIPNNPTTNQFLAHLQKKSKLQPPTTFTTTENHATATFCNFLTTGVGSAFPIIILPRLIPFLLTPIPRLFVRWQTNDGTTRCGSLTSGKGFIATGMQNGFALGFWGVGFSIFIPPLYAYGLFGYALFTSVNAEHIEPWPPNEPPEITPLNPPDEAKDIPLSTSELEFSLTDINHNLMNYTVTTQPYIGSGRDTNVTEGVFTVPVTDLEGSQIYQWTISVDDGTNFIQETFSFETEQIAPIVTNPYPQNNEPFIPINLTKLKFDLSDPQGDHMDYTVETSPNIGSGSGTNVPAGTYIINITNNLDYLTNYKWFINATDGENWKHQIFTFITEPILKFSDDFDDNIKDFGKWTEIYTDGDWFEQNQRTEFKVYEGGAYDFIEGIESIPTSITFGSGQAFALSCDMITEIEGASQAGHIVIEITDDINWIRLEYFRYKNKFVYYDSNDDYYIDLCNNKPDGTYNCYFKIDENGYQIKSDDVYSGIIEDQIFQTNTQLKLRLYIWNTGSTTSYFQQSGFDNVKCGTRF